MSAPPNLRLWFFLTSVVAVGGLLAVIIGGLTVKLAWFSLVLDRIP